MTPSYIEGARMSTVSSTGFWIAIGLAAFTFILGQQAGYHNGYQEASQRLDGIVSSECQSIGNSRMICTDSVAAATTAY